MDYKLGFWISLIINVITIIIIITLIQIVNECNFHIKKSRSLKDGLIIDEERANKVNNYECQHCNNITSFTNKQLIGYTHNYKCNHCNKLTEFSRSLTEEYISSKPKTEIVEYNETKQPIYSLICKHCETINLVDHLRKDVCFRCREVLPVVVT